MALTHAQPGQPIDIAPLGQSFRESATHAILKTRSLELIRVVLRAGESLPSHQVRGESMPLCIEGSADVNLDGTTCRLDAGQILLLPARLQHAIQAREDTSLLLTIQLTPGTPGSASTTS